MNLSRTFGDMGASAQVTSVFSKKDIQDMTAIFNYYDVTHTEKVSGSNLKHMLYMLGFVVDDDSISATRLYSRDEFLNVAAQLVTKDKIRRDDMKLAKKIFQMIDYSSHGSVDAVYLRRFLESTGIKVTTEQADNLVLHIDRGDEGDSFGVEDLDYYLDKFYTPFIDQHADEPDTEDEEERAKAEAEKEKEKAERKGKGINAAMNSSDESDAYSRSDAGSEVSRSDARSEISRSEAGSVAGDDADDADDADGDRMSEAGDAAADDGAAAGAGAEAADDGDHGEER